MSKPTEERRPLPPYIPFKTMSGFVEKLKDTVVPDFIDTSLLRSYSGSAGRQLIAAMKFLGLIEENGRTTDRLQSLVRAARTESWGEELSTLLFDAYRPITGDFDLDRGTPAQLDGKFRAWGADGQVLRKCVTFFLQGLAHAGITVSPHVLHRAKPVRNGKSRQHKKTTKDVGVVETGSPEHAAPAMAGVVKFSVPVPGKQSAAIFLPADLTADDWEMIETMMRAYIARMQKGK